MIEGWTRDSPYTLSPYTCTVSLVINIYHKSGIFDETNEPMLAYNNYLSAQLTWWLLTSLSKAFIFPLKAFSWVVFLSVSPYLLSDFYLSFYIAHLFLHFVYFIKTHSILPVALNSCIYNSKIRAIFNLCVFVFLFLWCSLWFLSWELHMMCWVK